jgi:hypothetical protein
VLLLEEVLVAPLLVVEVVPWERVGVLGLVVVEVPVLVVALLLPAACRMTGQFVLGHLDRHRDCWDLGVCWGPGDYWGPVDC